VEKMEKELAHIPPGEGGRSLWVFGELVTHKVPSHRRTGGAYALFEVATEPGAGPPPHINHREDEAFYVLEGEYRISSGEETLQVGSGSILYVRKGTLHNHTNVGEDKGRMLVSQTPGGLYERFFEEVGKPADGDACAFLLEEQLDARTIVAVAAEHGIEIPVPLVR